MKGKIGKNLRFKDMFVKSIPIFFIISLILISFQTTSVLTLDVEEEDEIILCSDNFNMTIDESKSFSKLVISDKYIGFNDSIFRVYSSGDEIKIILDFLHHNPSDANDGEKVLDISYESDERLFFSFDDLNHSMLYNIGDSYTCASEEGIAYFDLGKPSTCVSRQITACNESGSNIVVNSGSFDVSCEPVESFKSWELDIFFDTDRMNITSIEQGNIFDGFSQFFSDGTIDNENGIVYDVYNLIVGTGNVTDSGTLITVNYELVPGSTPSEVMFFVGITNETEYLPVTVNNIKI